MSTKNRSLITLAAVLLILFSCSFKAFAADQTYSWYCVHRRDHLQPASDSRFSFIEQYGGYYIDKKHGDDCDDKVLYLTFDVGYENGNVEKTLDVLKKEDVRGAFFVLGNVVENNTELLNRMFDEGHLVCNHTFSHGTIIGKGQEELYKELKKLEDSCYERTGKNMSKYFRPPEGRFDEKSLEHLNKLGYKTVFWSFAYADWDNERQMNFESAKEKILSNVHNGEIMLLHPTSATNAAILGEVIAELKGCGFRFGTLDELCEE